MTREIVNEMDKGKSSYDLASVLSQLLVIKM